MCSLDGRSGTNKGGLHSENIVEMKEEICAMEDQARSLLWKRKTSKLGWIIVRTNLGGHSHTVGKRERHVFAI